MNMVEDYLYLKADGKWTLDISEAKRFDQQSAKTATATVRRSAISIAHKYAESVLVSDVKPMLITGSSRC